MLNAADFRDAIVACSTCMQSNSAVAIIRISGFSDLLKYQKFFSTPLDRIKRKKNYLSNILDGDVVVDQCLLVYFEAPNSYTGENILELSIHGNVLNIKKILKLISSGQNTRIAKPGEFTQRAFLNKKINLTQVEGLDLVLNARTDLALRSGQELLGGKIGKLYQQLYDKYVALISALELSIDFSEDVGEKEARELTLARFNDLKGFVLDLYQKIYRGRSLTLNPEVAIIGPVNAGKSTLFNLLVGDDRAIVSAKPGTTRDYLSEEVLIEGIPFRIIDTAGIRETGDEIETQGINKSKKFAAEAFFTLQLINPLQSQDAKFESADLTIFTHADLENFDQAVARAINGIGVRPYLMASLEGAGPIGASSVPGPIGADSSGPIGPLREQIFEMILQKYRSSFSNDRIFMERHCDLIEKIYSEINKINLLEEYENDVALCAAKLRQSGHWIEQLIGVVSSDQVLNSIFANFCIGK